MGFLSSIIDLYENVRPSKRKSKKNYEADTSGFTGSRKDDLEKYKVENSKINAQTSNKNENLEDEVDKER